jgi:hypothetical protein
MKKSNNPFVNNGLGYFASCLRVYFPPDFSQTWTRFAPNGGGFNQAQFGLPIQS